MTVTVTNCYNNNSRQIIIINCTRVDSTGIFWLVLVGCWFNLVAGAVMM